MLRVPEPEIMDGSEQSAAYAAADFAEVNADFVTALLARFPGQQWQQVVDLGCGPADICVRLAQQLPAVNIVGLDASAEMLGHGERAITELGLGSQIRLHQRYLPSIAGIAPADAVISNSLLHHLAAPETLWQAIGALGKPGAAVYVMDLARPASRDDAQEIVDRLAADEPEVLRHDFFHSLCAAYRTGEVRKQLDSAGLTSLIVEMVSDRHLCVHGTLPLTDREN
ncbi:MAG: class I SAM-dependent methyltransferase [Myxococcales bacterium]|nr:class I SAM-dependent methyltransferase [Myxococcales bacterium]